MKPTIVIMLFVCFFQNYAQSTHIINVTIDQEKNCEPLSIGGNESSTFQIFPSPVNTYLNVKSSTSIDEIIVYNLMGQEVMKYLVKKSAIKIDVSHLQSSIYLLQVKTDSEVSNRKIVIRHE